jgi:Ca2+-dependent lipid-binding protein
MFDFVQFIKFTYVLLFFASLQPIYVWNSRIYKIEGNFRNPE